jgi:uncharacterized protein
MNRLGRETSPYLLQHADNPVHWWSWGEEALAEAQRTNRPILLSVGYAACHWCHVMAHESFESPEVAAVMNELFVNIKVDREERPDVDAIYMQALQIMGEHGGWPLTMFCTPKGEPFWGGTYFPTPARYGRPAFVDVLKGVAQTWRQRPQDIETNRAGLLNALRSRAVNKAVEFQGETMFPLSLLDQVAGRIVQECDMTWGGFGQAPKFPSPYVFELLWRGWLRDRSNCKLTNAVTITLDRMCQGGIYDHLAGGFARYATDNEWLIPHFEKMLYDNAQLIDLLCLVWQETKSPLYGQRIDETLGWVIREMLTPEGGFASSLDADSEHEEGKFYVWSEAEIDAVLGQRGSLFKRFYNVTAEGNWEGKSILNRSETPELSDEETERDLAASRARLLQVREKRVRPGWDDKVLADWNGLMIAAMANAGTVFERPEWVATAQRAFEFVRRQMTTADGRLLHSWRAGRARHPATVDDYANLCRGALVLLEAAGEEDFLSQTREWLVSLERYYWDEAGGGYFFAASDTEGLIARSKTAADSAVPAGNGTLVGVLSRLATLTGDEAYGRRAEAIVETFSGEVGRNFFPLATLLNNLEVLQKPLQIVLIGKRDDPAFRSLQRASYAVSLPNRVILTLAPGAPLPSGHPAFGKGLVAGKPAVYVCEGPVCSLPITGAEELRKRLEAGRA